MMPIHGATNMFSDFIDIYLIDGIDSATPGLVWMKYNNDRKCENRLVHILHKVVILWYLLMALFDIKI